MLSYYSIVEKKSYQSTSYRFEHPKLKYECPNRAPSCDDVNDNAEEFHRHKDVS